MLASLSLCVSYVRARTLRNLVRQFWLQLLRRLSACLPDTSVALRRHAFLSATRFRMLYCPKAGRKLPRVPLEGGAW